MARRDDEEARDAAAFAQAEAEGNLGAIRMRTANERNREIYGIADQLMGGSRVKVNCSDGKSRLGRIPGKMKKRQWIRTGDLLIVKPWDFQDDKCDVLYRYTRTQAVNLARRGHVPDSVNIFS